jgi:hypothetical protein
VLSGSISISELTTCIYADSPQPALTTTSSEMADHVSLSLSRHSLHHFQSIMPTQDKPLTKKQKKALAHRDKSERKTKAKGKSSAQEEPLAVPEADVEEEEKADRLAQLQHRSNKRKREDRDDDASDKENEDGEEVKEGKMAKRRRKAREKKAAEAEAKASRLIVFAGNLPYKTTKEEIEAHFEQTGQSLLSPQRGLSLMSSGYGIRREADCSPPHTKGRSRRSAKGDGKDQRLRFRRIQNGLCTPSRLASPRQQNGQARCGGNLLL